MLENKRRKEISKSVLNFSKSRKKQTNKQNNKQIKKQTNKQANKPIYVTYSRVLCLQKKSYSLQNKCLEKHLKQILNSITVYK